MARPLPDELPDDWLWGWDRTPGIVGLVADGAGHATVWRRIEGALVRETARFRPWTVHERIDANAVARGATFRELEGEGEVRYLARADHVSVIASGATIMVPPEEQYLVSTGRNYFHGLAFDDLARVQIDLETTGLDPQRDRIFMIALRAPSGAVELLEVGSVDDAGERAVIARLCERIAALDPDVIENHNLHGFDLPFLERRAKLLGVPLMLGRDGVVGLGQRGARRGVAIGAGDGERRVRFTVAGRELIDTLDMVLRHDFATRDLPGHGLKAVAKHFGVAKGDRELIPGDRVFDTWQRDPDRVRRYATADVEEVAGLARMLGGAAFALARLVPRRYERLADAGPATGVIDPLLVRTYLRAGAALPAHRAGDGTEHNGAALHLFAAGVARRVVKADVASLYPSLMREYRIGPARDRLGALLALVDRLVDQRLAAKAAAKAAPAGSAERFAHEAVSAAMKLVVNSAYGYLGAGSLTRFSDIHAANEVTRRGRETLDLMCRELAARGVTLVEADTDGVYFSVPETWSTADERRAVAEVDALLPAKVSLELEGRYAAMLSHEPKNYALLTYPKPRAADGVDPELVTRRGADTFDSIDVAASIGGGADGSTTGATRVDGSGGDGELVLRGVAFRSSRAEPFGEAFLRRAVMCLFADDIIGLQRTYLATIAALRRRDLPTHDVSARVRLAKTPAEYLASRDSRRELAYEALLAAGRTTWSVGERIRIYRDQRGLGALVTDPDDLADSDALSPGDAQNRDSSVRDSAVRDSAVRDSSVRDSSVRDSSVRDSAVRDSPVRDSVVRDSADRDSAVRDEAVARRGERRDYDVDHYVRVLREHFASRFVRALEPEVFAAVFADPDQLSLFAPDLRVARSILTRLGRE